MGIVGTTFFVFIIYEAFKMSYRLYKNVSDPKIKYFSLAILSIIVGLAVDSIFIDIFESSKIAFYFWFLIGLISGYYSTLGEKKLS